MTVVRDWLESRYGQSPGYFAATFFEAGRVRATRWYDATTLDRAAATIEKYADRLDVYTSVATHVAPQSGGRRGSHDTVVSLSGLWADLDIGEAGHQPAASGLPNPGSIEEAMSILEDLPAPTTVIHSGGGLQVWWTFDEPWSFKDPDRAAAATEAWQRGLIEAGEKRGFHVDSVGDLPRILRVPGTQNHKLDEPRPVRVLSDDGPVYDLDDLLPDRATPTAPPEPEGPYNDWPEDTFPLSWNEILEPHGWQSFTPGLWWRPGKGRTEGHSATTDHAGVPVMVVFSASAGLPMGAGQKLTKLKVYALLNFHGDAEAARKSLEEKESTDPDALAVLAEKFADRRIQWGEFWQKERTGSDWFCEPLIERGRQVALYSEAKCGKSLLSWDICVKLSQGLPTLGRKVGRAPVRVLYIDQENTEDDIFEKIGEKMGFLGEDLPNFFYYSFPSMSWLDTPQGALELYALAKYHEAELVVLDTLSRVVEGDENDNDTYHNFYKHSGAKLKRDGIALLRLDHAGKEVSKGMRGASSKTTDVDEVWQMAKIGTDVLQLTRTHTRTNHGSSSIVVERRDLPTLSHVLEDAGADLVELTDDDDPGDPPWYTRMTAAQREDLIAGRNIQDIAVSLGVAKSTVSKYGKRIRE